MIAEVPSRTVIKDLQNAKWMRLRTVGSHSMWQCPTGQHSVSVPDGHRTISAGVVRKIRKALAGCDCEKG